MHFFLMSQGSFNPKIRFLGQKVCPVARPQTDTQTHTKVNTDRGHPFRVSGFFLQPVIKDRPNKHNAELRRTDPDTYYVNLAHLLYPVKKGRPAFSAVS